MDQRTGEGHSRLDEPNDCCCLEQGIEVVFTRRCRLEIFFFHRDALEPRMFSQLAHIQRALLAIPLGNRLKPSGQTIGQCHAVASSGIRFSENRGLAAQPSIHLNLKGPDTKGHLTGFTGVHDVAPQS